MFRRRHSAADTPDQTGQAAIHKHTHDDTQIAFERAASAATEASHGGLTEGSRATGITSHAVADMAQSAKEGVCRAGHAVSVTAHLAYNKSKEALGKAN